MIDLKNLVPGGRYTFHIRRNLNSLMNKKKRVLPSGIVSMQSNPIWGKYAAEYDSTGNILVPESYQRLMKREHGEEWEPVGANVFWHWTEWVGIVQHNTAPDRFYVVTRPGTSTAFHVVSKATGAYISAEDEALFYQYRKPKAAPTIFKLRAIESITNAAW